MAPLLLTTRRRPVHDELHVWCWPAQEPGPGRPRQRSYRAPALEVLAGYLGCDASELRVEAGPWGKPFLPGTPRLHFSLSDSSGAGVMAVSAGPVGIDLEKVRERAWDDLAERLFGAADWQAFQSIPPAARGSAFAHAWTQREAFVKATGLGLGQGWMPAHETFARAGPAPGPIGGSHPLEGGKWHLRSISLWPGFACTVCTSAPVSDLRIRRRLLQPARPGFASR